MKWRIQPVPNAQELLDFAFKGARLQTPDFSKKIRKKERWAKEIEKNKIEEVSGLLEERLKKTADSFPGFDKMPLFYRELLDASIGLEETRKELSFLKKRAHLIQRLKSATIQQIFASVSVSKIRKLSQSFYGRVSSIVKKMDKELKKLEQKRKQIQALPSIQTDAFTVLLAGFPNVGKTTLLNKLTGSEPRIASFPFTTQNLKIGFFLVKFFSVQVIDTPGILDRPDDRRNPIEKKALAALHHLGEMVLFLADPSLSSGFSLEQQAQLWKELRQSFKTKKTRVVLTKTDLCSSQQLEEANRLFPNAMVSSDPEAIKKEITVSMKDWIEETKPDYSKPKPGTL